MVFALAISMINYMKDQGVIVSNDLSVTELLIYTDKLCTTSNTMAVRLAHFLVVLVYNNYRHQLISVK